MPMPVEPISSKGRQFSIMEVSSHVQGHHIWNTALPGGNYRDFFNGLVICFGILPLISHTRRPRSAKKTPAVWEKEEEV